MDIYNGDIVSLVSSPVYDPNAFVHGIDKTYWDSLINNSKKPLINKARKQAPIRQDQQSKH